MVKKFKKNYYKKFPQQLKKYKKKKNLKRINSKFFRFNYDSVGALVYIPFYKEKAAKYIKKGYKAFFDFSFKRKILYTYTYKNLRRIKVDIRLTPRNMFCTLVDLKRNKTVHVASSGAYKIKISRRYRKKTAIFFLNKFFKKIGTYCKHFRNTIFNITAAKRLRKKLSYFLRWKIRKFKKFYAKRVIKTKKKIRVRVKKRRVVNSIINIISKKSYNGCRAKKRVRLKRRRAKRLKVL
jgi:hypothetical protein